jgi:hypothetical protein
MARADMIPMPPSEITLCAFGGKVEGCESRFLSMQLTVCIDGGIVCGLGSKI